MTVPPLTRRERLIFVLILFAVLALFAILGAVAGDDYDVNCPQLKTQTRAQQVLMHDPSDPFRLDGDHDGKPCEGLPK